MNSLNPGIGNFWKFGIVKECIIDIGIILKNDTEDLQIHLFLYYKF